MGRWGEGGRIFTLCFSRQLDDLFLWSSLKELTKLRNSPSVTCGGDGIQGKTGGLIPPMLPIS
ncbi:MAG: hypothetical protein F6K16_18560 [Symploca sp. SIO2B6]|nr:hypothetical protein [Symploca sp. SIO2B6]